MHSCLLFWTFAVLNSFQLLTSFYPCRPCPFATFAAASAFLSRCARNDLFFSWSLVEYIFSYSSLFEAWWIRFLSQSFQSKNFLLVDLVEISPEVPLKACPNQLLLYKGHCGKGISDEVLFEVNFRSPKLNKQQRSNPKAKWCWLCIPFPQ